MFCFDHPHGSLALRRSFLALFGCLLSAATASAAGPREPMTVTNVFLRLSDDIQLPAREAGVLAELPIAEGDVVEAGTIVARVEDRQARLMWDRTKIEVDIARREADREIEIEYARKALGVAQAELTRAERSREAVAGAVSLTEVDRLRLVAEKADAEIRRIEQEQATALLSAKLKEAEAELAALRLERHTTAAPMAGQIVEHFHKVGEWVEPGEPVVRLIRLDVLRAEGYLEANRASPKLVGSTVGLNVGSPGQRAATFTGRITFVAPEVEPTTGQVLIRATIDNPDLALHPGLRGEMTIEPAENTLPPAPPARGSDQ